MGNWLGKVWRSLPFLVRRRRFERELEAEMRFHLEMLIEEYLDTGMTLQQARRAARLRFGDNLVIKQRSRDMWGFGWTAFWGQNLRDSFRQAARTLLKRPAFSLVAILTLALGIGANTAIFSVAYAVLLRPLPYQGAERIASVAEVLRIGGEYSSGPAYLDWRDQSQTMQALAAYDHTALNLTGSSEPERLRGASVSYQFFEVLGVAAAKGRFFGPQQDRPGGERVVVVTQGFWNRMFGPQTDLKGQTLMLDDQSYRVSGVLESAFKFPHSPDTEVILPYALNEEAERNSNTISLLKVMGRLKEQATLQEAQAELQLIRQRRSDGPKAEHQAQVVVTPLQEEISSGVRPALAVLLAVVGFLLLIACLNVANLLLARWTKRQREVWIRTALGLDPIEVLRYE